MVLRIVYVVVGVIMIATGVIYVKYRHEIVRASTGAQRKLFGDWVRVFQQGQNASSMVVAGILAMVMGASAIVLAIAR